MESWDVNVDESRVPEYTLPDPLILSDGTRVADAQTWVARRRPEILRLFEQHVYGKVPDRPEDMTFNVTSVDREALGGRATRKEVSVYFQARQTVRGWIFSSTCPTAAPGLCPPSSD
jgi:hypothetical protein